MTRHVVILAGGLSHERDVSLRSGSRLHEALKGSGVDVTVRDTDSDLISWLAETKPDAAIITLHGSRGEHGAIQGILEMSGVPFLGTNAKNCRLAYEKNIAKNLVQRGGFTTPRWMTLSHSTFRDLGAQTLIRLLVSHLGLPLMVKPQHGGSALGATPVRAADELPAALVNAFAYGEIAVVERNQAVSGDGDEGPSAGRDQLVPNVRITSSSLSSTVARRRTPSTIRSEVGKQYDSRS